MPKGVYKKTKEHCRKLSEAHKGKKLSEEHKKKIGKAQKGRKQPPVSQETRRKMSESQKGRKGYWLGKKKPPLSKEQKRKISQALKGRNFGYKFQKGYKMSDEQIKRMSEARKGSGNPAWRGGISKEPYSQDWTETLKRSIRERDNYVCQLCGKLQGDRAFAVHHIDYDKKNCNPDNLITLCAGCHIRVNTHRNYWTNYFQQLCLTKTQS